MTSNRGGRVVHRQTSIFDRMDRLRLVLTLAGILGGAAVTAGAILWTYAAEPRIQCKIDERVQPIEDAMALQVFLTMETMDSAKVAAATAKYKQYKLYSAGVLP